MGLINDLKDIGKDIDSDAKKLGDEVEKDLEKAKKAVDDGLKRVEAFAEDELKAAIEDYINEALGSAKSKYKPVVQNAASFAQQTTSSTDKSILLSDVKKSLDPSNPDQNAANDVLSNSPPMIFSQQGDLKGNANSYKKSGFHSASVGGIGEVDLVIGAAASAGAGVKWDLSDKRFIIDFGLSIGAEEGVDAGAFVGFWTKDPRDLQEPYIAAVLEADFVVGVGVKFYFSMFEGDFIGFVVVVNAGEEFDAGFEVGYTTVFRFPD